MLRKVQVVIYSTICRREKTLGTCAGREQAHRGQEPALPTVRREDGLVR